jgi:hypothetical protein
VKGFSRKQRKRVEAAFHTFAGADILIDFGEWKRALGMRNDFLARRIFDVVDADGTGFIDRDEFLAFAAQLYSEDRKKRLELIFRIYDLDGDGPNPGGRESGRATEPVRAGGRKRESLEAHFAARKCAFKAETSGKSPRG